MGRLPRGLTPLLLALTGVWAAVPAPRPTPRQGRVLHVRALAGSAWVLPGEGGKGSAWLVDSDRRLLVTCYHVVGESDTAWLVFPLRDNGGLVGPRQHYLTHLPALKASGRAVRARVVRRSRDADLALLQAERLPADVQPLPLAPTPAGAGDRVCLVGNRYDVDVLWTHATGAVQARKTLRDGYYSAGRQLAKGARSLVASVPINEGDSGAALLDDAGQVVGVAAAVAGELHGATLAIDLFEVRKLLDAPPASPDPAVPTGVAAIHRRASRAVALVRVGDGSPRAGVLLDRSRRLVATTAEAVGRDRQVEVTFPVEQAGAVVVEHRWYRSEDALLRRRGQRSSGVVLAVDPRRNLALLELPRLPPDLDAPGLAEDVPQPGDLLQAISHPRRLEVGWAHLSASLRQRGHAALGQSSDGPEPAVLLLQATVGEDEGGGPVLDHTGRLVGLLTGRGTPQQQVAYALDLSELRGLLVEQQALLAPRTAADHLERGRLFLRARQFERAEAAFTAALRYDAGRVEALLERSAARLGRGEQALAQADAEHALRLQQRSPLALCRRAAVQAIGNPEAALRDLDAALRLAPRLAEGHALRGRVRLTLGQDEAARADLDEAIWLDSRLAPAYQARGTLEARHGRLTAALADLDRATALDPDDPATLAERGALHVRRDDRPAARADFARALRLAPNHIPALLGRAQLRAAAGTYDEALADLDALLRLDAGHAAALAARGSERLRRGRFAAAIEDLVRAIQNDATPVPDLLAELERRLEQRGEAAEVQTAVYRPVLRAVRDRLPAGSPLRRTLEGELVAAEREQAEPARLERLRGAARAVRAAWRR